MPDKKKFVATVFDEKNDPNKVTVAFTMALKALEKGHDSTLVLMVGSVRLARPGYADDIDIGAPFRPIRELMKDFLARGGRLAVCAACLKHNHIPEADIIKGLPIITADEVIDLLMGADGTLQVT